MIPGLGESKNVFKPLWREVLKDRFMVAAINYPSTQKRIEGHVRQLDFFLNHLEDVNKVSFVTSGIGGIVLKALFSLESPWRKRLKIGRIVEVAPKNHGQQAVGSPQQEQIARLYSGTDGRRNGTAANRSHTAVSERNRDRDYFERIRSGAGNGSSHRHQRP